MTHEEIIDTLERSVEFLPRGEALQIARALHRNIAQQMSAGVCSFRKCRREFDTTEGRMRRYCTALCCARERDARKADRLRAAR